MIKTVLFFVSSPFVARDYERYGMDFFVINGFDIYVWDFSPFLAPAALGSAPAIKWSRRVVFKDSPSVVAALARCPKDSFIFTSVPYGADTFAIYRAVSRRRIPYCVNVASALPALAREPASYVSKLLRITPRRLFSYYLQHSPLRLSGISPASFVLAEGAKSSIARPEVNGATQIIRAHSLDYNIYLRLGRKGVTTDGSAVFLDSYLPFHPDYLHCTDDEPVQPQSYYAPLRRFFDVFERKTGLNVVIAAHPRSNYEQMGEPFGPRLIVKDSTAEMVKCASAVITEHSTAVSFAVLYRKPIVFITTAELERLSVGKYSCALASQFGKRPLRIDRPLVEDCDFLSELRVDEAAYADYQNSYIKVAGTEELASWQILCNRIRRL